jgi:hypothetical protein
MIATKKYAIQLLVVDSLASAVAFTFIKICVSFVTEVSYPMEPSLAVGLKLGC